MQNVSVLIKQRKLQKIYKAHANEVYRICLHYLKDEKKAQDITEQVFLELYKKMDEVNSNHVMRSCQACPEGNTTESLTPGPAP